MQTYKAAWRTTHRIVNSVVHDQEARKRTLRACGRRSPRPRIELRQELTTLISYVAILALRPSASSVPDYQRRNPDPAENAKPDE